jgi:AcrR family transcriptional regulator
MAGTRNERSERILRAAMHLFYERGFDGVGVDLIGERAGMSGPAIYRYFSGKDEILITLIDEAIDRVQESVGSKHQDPGSELDHLIRGHIQRAIEERELMSVWTRERNSIPRQYRTRLRARVNRYITRWVECLDANYPGHSRDVLTAAVHAIHGMIDSTAAWPQQSLKIDGLGEILTGLAYSSLNWLTATEERSSNSVGSGRSA